MKTKVVLILVTVALAGCAPSADSNKPQVQEAKVPISHIAGTYRQRDGIKQITIKEVFAEDGWNGVIVWEPAIGDWARPVRCRISGSTVLAVEIPAPSGRFVAAMFTLVDRSTIRGEAQPWQGEFTRIR